MSIGKKADEISDHLRFLVPLASSTKDMHSRIMGIIDEHSNKNVYFHAFFLEFPSDDLNKKSYFCVPPPRHDDPVLDNHFSPLSSALSDEIQGHMNLFSKEINKDIYWEVISRTCEIILDSVSHVK